MMINEIFMTLKLLNLKLCICHHMLVTRFLKVEGLQLPLSVPEDANRWQNVGVAVPELLLFDILMVENNCELSKGLLNIDNALQESFIGTSHFPKSTMDCYPSQVPKLAPLEMHLRKWCEQCRDITTKWDTVTDAVVNPKKQVDSFTIDSVISS